MSIEQSPPLGVDSIQVVNQGIGSSQIYMNCRELARPHRRWVLVQDAQTGRLISAEYRPDLGPGG